MVLHRLGERAEDDAELRQLRLERRGDRDRVEHRVDGDAGEHLLLFERNAELLERLPHLRVHVVQAVELLLRLGRRVVADASGSRRRVGDVRPGRLLHREPGAVGLQPPFEHPLRFALLRRDGADDVFVQAGRQCIGVDGGLEPVLVFASGELFDGFGGCAHACSSRIGLEGAPFRGQAIGLAWETPVPIDRRGRRRAPASSA